MMRIIKYRIGILILLLTLLCGCSAPIGKPSGPTHMVTDCSGREVAVPDTLDSVACLYAYAGHACVLLGQEGRLTSVVAGLKRDHLMKRKIPNIEELPVPYNDRAINIEELLASGPDLVLLRGEALVNEGEQQKLTKTGIPYVVIDYDTMEEQKNSIRVLGEVFGCEDRSKEYLDYYEEMLQLVRERTEQVPEEDRLSVYHSVNEVVRTDVPGSISDEILLAVGVKNVIHDGSELQQEGSKVYSSVEQIYLWDPDWILCNEAAATEYFRTDAKMEGLRAVREDRVLQLPVGISRWGHPGSIETPMAALYLGKTLYPEYFADVDLDEEVKAFYQRFIGMELTGEELENIYSGSGMREVKERKEQ